jgi:hypothetical protein
MTDAPPSESDIREEIERIENTLDDVNAPIEEHYKHDGYLKGLKFALGEFTPDTPTTPSTETINRVAERAAEQFPESDVLVKRDATPPTYEEIAVTITVTIDSVDEWQHYQDKLEAIARDEETDNEFVLTRVERNRSTDNPD